MSNERINLPTTGESQKRAESETKFLEFLAECLNKAECLEESWCPTKCEKNCVVEPDGVCPHGFKSVALEFGFI